MSLCAYSNLKQHTLNSVSRSDRIAQILNTLKELYKNDINSKRRLEQTTTIGQLLHILEIRDILSENDIGPLKEISQMLRQNSELLKKIDQYEESHMRTAYENYHAPDITQRSCNRPHTGKPTNHQHANLSIIKKQKIIDVIVKEIGISWRDLARNLKLSEPSIENIDNSCNSLPAKLIKILELYGLEDNRHIIELCDALKKIRRKDLSILLQEIMETNS